MIDSWLFLINQWLSIFINRNSIVCLLMHFQYLGDSQTFVKALLDWSSKNFFGGLNAIFVSSLYYFWPKKRFFLPFSRFFLHQKNLASFLVILVQVYFPSQGTQKSLNTGLPHHFGIVQSWSFRSENFRGLGSQKNSGHCLEC